MASNQKALNSFYSMLDGENQLVEDAKQGDKEAFRRLYEHYVDPIYRFVSLKVSGREIAEDLTHEVFLSSWQNIKGYKNRGLPFSSWLYRIARNKVIDHYRTSKATFDIELASEELATPAFQLERLADQALDLERLKVCLVRLTPDQQDVTIMRFIDEMSHREIAEVIGKSEGAVRVIQHRALSTLRSLLLAKPNEEEISEV